VKAYHALIAKLVLSDAYALLMLYQEKEPGSELLGRIGTMGGAQLLQY
jgi:hypothetical protein